MEKGVQRDTIYIPIVSGKKFNRFCGLWPQCLKLVELIRKDERQKRKSLTCVEELSRAAQDKAEQFREMNFFDHTSLNGETPNELIRRYGYRLPDWYDGVGNNVESLAINYQLPEEVMEAWAGSPGHRAHVFGESDFYRGQSYIGLGYAQRPYIPVQFSTWWVVLIAH